MYAYVIIILFITRTNEGFVDAQSKISGFETTRHLLE